MHGRGPFLTQTPTENALALQVFLLVMAIPLILLAVVVEEEKTLEECVAPERSPTTAKGRAALNDQLRFERLSTDISSTLMKRARRGIGKTDRARPGADGANAGIRCRFTMALDRASDTALRCHGWRKPDRPGLPRRTSRRRIFRGR